MLLAQIQQDHEASGGSSLSLSEYNVLDSGSLLHKLPWCYGGAYKQANMAISASHADYCNDATAVFMKTQMNQ